MATAFLALVWDGLENQKGLLSWHPARFLSSCLVLIGLFYLVIAANLGGPLQGKKNRDLTFVRSIEAIWDGLFATILNLLMGILVFAWLLVVSPLFYALVLLTGAPARRAIRDTGIKVVVRENQFETLVEEIKSEEQTPDGYKEVSFNVKPFALTNALNALVLYVLKLIIFS